MGFATSLQALTRLTLKSLPATLSLNPNFSSDDASDTAAKPASFTTNRPKAKQISIPVMRANRGRSRLGSNTLCPQTFAATPELQSPITDESRQAASPRLLKIVQREPRKQPECLLICGRMADVCAALERMALHEQTAPQV
ncbi:hypothetical protein CTR2_R32960 [Comamonas thiooxydans]|uniref:hypothetical protein n=1 Tax=Comamonas thiooxydans TaxID=363952 RepID=UPI000A2DB346|nr:hypothetical protein [Comamonas thiooxydans]BDR09958.1 hypothetical protein CTR2_R32960 [Comamonas thiooxydans]